MGCWNVGEPGERNVRIRFKDMRTGARCAMSSICFGCQGGLGWDGRCDGNNEALVFTWRGWAPRGWILGGEKSGGTRGETDLDYGHKIVLHF